MKQIKGKQGFTVLEMIVVLCIISAIFLLAIPNIQKVLTTVDKKSCQALTKVVDSAILEYRLEYEENPGSVSDLVSAGYLSEAQMTCGGQSVQIQGGQAVLQ